MCLDLYTGILYTSLCISSLDTKADGNSYTLLTDIQGDSDSESDVISDISSKLALLLNDDDGDDTTGDDGITDDDGDDTTADILTDGYEDENVEAAEMPVFLTSMGPISANAGITLL